MATSNKYFNRYDEEYKAMPTWQVVLLSLVCYVLIFSILVVEHPIFVGLAVAIVMFIVFRMLKADEE